MFGFYLLYYSLATLPYLNLLYSKDGLYSDYQTLPFFPNLLAFNDSTVTVFTLGLVTLVASAFIMIGWQRRASALALWLVLACFFGRNIYTEDPSLPFVTLLLVLLTLIPEGEPLSFARRKVDWAIPYFVYFTALFALGVGYTISGYDKFLAIGWQMGDAMSHLYTLSIAHDNLLTEWLRQQPLWLTQLQTWLAGGAMLIALPTLLWQRTRRYIWFVLTAMFVFVFFTLDLNQVSFGILLFHLFLLDQAWLPGKQSSHVTLWYDHRCNLCRRYKSFIEQEDIKSITKFKHIEDYNGEAKPATEPATTIVLEVDGQTYTHSDAVLENWALIGGVWRLLSVCGYLMPKSWRDAVYDIVGRNRYRWFGACDDTCSV